MSQSMSHARRRRVRIATGAAAVLAVASLQPAAGTHRIVTAVASSAYGYHGDNLAFAGNPQADAGPTPSITLASDASNSPQSASDPTAQVQVMGVATILTSDQLTVNTSGSLGTTGSTTSSSIVTNLNKATSQPATGSEILTADAVQSSCTASESGVTRTTTLTNATLQTDSGHDINGDDDFDDAGEHPPVVVSLPSTPTPGLTMIGHIHIGSAVDDFRVVFHQLGTGPGGSSTVTAVHETFGTAAPDFLTGELSLGHSLCGVTTAPAADLTMGITDAPDPVLTEQLATYSVNVSNLGPEPASNIAVASSLAGAKRVDSASGPAGPCTVSTGEPKAISCTVGILASGGSALVTIVAEAPKKAGVMTLTSTVSSPADGTPANNTDTETTPVVRP